MIWLAPLFWAALAKTGKDYIREVCSKSHTKSLYSKSLHDLLKSLLLSFHGSVFIFVNPAYRVSPAKVKENGILILVYENVWSAPPILVSVRSLPLSPGRCLAPQVAKVHANCGACGGSNSKYNPDNPSMWSDDSWNDISSDCYNVEIQECTFEFGDSQTIYSPCLSELQVRF